MQIKSIDLSLLVKKVCDVDGVSVGKLKCGSRGRIVNARRSTLLVISERRAFWSRGCPISGCHDLIV
jgi:hypothetical protein